MSDGSTHIRSRTGALVPSHVDAAIERAHEATRDAVRYLSTEAPQETRSARRIAALAYHAHREALEIVGALEGHTLERDTLEGRAYLRVTPRVLTSLRACLDACYGLARKWCAVERTISPVVPMTRAVGVSMASRYASTSSRTWSRYLPWLHVAGLVVYLAGSDNHPTLVGLPHLARRSPGEARAALVDRRGRGFLSWSDDEVARGGLWWRPVVDAMLDDDGDVWARLAHFDGLVEEWRYRVAEAAKAKQAAILERIASKRPGARPVVNAALRRQRTAAESAAAARKNKPTETPAFFGVGGCQIGNRDGPTILSESPGTTPAGSENGSASGALPSGDGPLTPQDGLQHETKSRSGAPPPNPRLEREDRTQLAARVRDALRREHGREPTLYELGRAIVRETGGR